VLVFGVADLAPVSASGDTGPPPEVVAEALPNLIRNPSFTDAAPKTGLWWDVSPATSPYFVSPWRVTKHYGQLVAVDHVDYDGRSAFHMGSWRLPAAGGNIPGAIEQTITTPRGRALTISFDYAPLRAPLCQQYAGKASIKVTVETSQDGVAIYRSEQTVSASTVDPDLWNRSTFRPGGRTGTTTKIGFESLPGTSMCSLMITNVQAY